METNLNQTPPSRDTWLSKARDIYSKLPFNRSYALDPVALQSMAALGASWHERYVAEQTSLGKSTAHSLEQLVPTFAELSVYVPSMFSKGQPLNRPRRQCGQTQSRANQRKIRGLNRRI